MNMMTSVLHSPMEPLQTMHRCLTQKDDLPHMRACRHWHAKSMYVDPKSSWNFEWFTKEGPSTHVQKGV